MSIAFLRGSLDNPLYVFATVNFKVYRRIKWIVIGIMPVSCRNLKKFLNEMYENDARYASRFDAENVPSRQFKRNSDCQISEDIEALRSWMLEKKVL